MSTIQLIKRTISSTPCPSCHGLGAIEGNVCKVCRNGRLEIYSDVDITTEFMGIFKLDGRYKVRNQARYLIDKVE